MSKSTYVVRSAAALLAALIAACTSGAGTPPATRPAGPTEATTATALPPHPTACGAGARAFWLPGPDHTALAANTLGEGRTAVVFLHQAGTGADMCGFWPYARWLVAHRHVRAVLFNRCTYPESTCQVFQVGDRGIRAQVQPAVDWARQHGARRVVLIGASSGASDAIQAGGVVTGVSGVVALSSDVTDTQSDERIDARRLRVPALLAVAPNDSDAPIGQVRTTLRLIRARDKQLIVVRSAEGAHGWDLLTEPQHPDRFAPLARTVADFVVSH